jgi:L-ribulokinase
VLAHRLRGGQRGQVLVQVDPGAGGRLVVARRHLLDSSQGPALGAALHAAVAAGEHADIHAASEAMGRVRRGAYAPDPAAAEAYDELYAHDLRLHDHFGRGGDDVMHALRRPRPVREFVGD